MRKKWLALKFPLLVLHLVVLFTEVYVCSSTVFVLESLELFRKIPNTGMLSRVWATVEKIERTHLAVSNTDDGGVVVAMAHVLLGKLRKVESRIGG